MRGEGVDGGGVVPVGAAFCLFARRVEVMFVAMALKKKFFFTIVSQIVSSPTGMKQVHTLTYAVRGFMCYVCTYVHVCMCAHTHTHTNVHTDLVGFYHPGTPSCSGTQKPPS